MKVSEKQLKKCIFATDFELFIWKKAKHESDELLREFIFDRPEIQLFK